MCVHVPVHGLTDTKGELDSFYHGVTEEIIKLHRGVDTMSQVRNHEEQPNRVLDSNLDSVPQDLEM